MTAESKPTSEPQITVADAYARALNHVGSARWELERAHPHMDPEEPCHVYTLWAALKEIERQFPR